MEFNSQSNNKRGNNFRRRDGGADSVLPDVAGRLVPRDTEIEAAVLGALIDRALAQLHFIVLKGIGADQRGAVCVYIEGYIVGGASENPGKIFSQYVFTGGLGS